MPSPYLYSFTVMGRAGRFPVDMLRYDSCWPATGDDAAKLHDAIRGYEDPEKRRDMVEIRMLTYTRGGPTVGRWGSFGWGCKVND